MSGLILFNKPFQVLSQFTSQDGRRCLSDYIQLPGYYPAGRLDYDSEGLLLLTNDGRLQHRISHPNHKMQKCYWALVEGSCRDDDLALLRRGVELKDGKTKPAEAKSINAPDIWERTPPIRDRQTIPTSWIKLVITEGRNRQVRRMTAHLGYPTLRLIRHAIGPWNLDGIEPGEYRQIEVNLPTEKQRFKKKIR